MAARDSVAHDMATKETVIERVFDAPRERVFDVFTQPEHLQKWWGPRMVGIPFAEFDARAGGKIFIAERRPDGAMNYIAGVVREIASVTISAEGRRTRVTIRVHRSGVTAEFVENARLGWGESLDKLGYAIADDPSPRF
jgi:hypothetical protein